VDVGGITGEEHASYPVALSLSPLAKEAGGPTHLLDPEVGARDPVQRIAYLVDAEWFLEGEVRLLLPALQDAATSSFVSRARNLGSECV
jgi:hypothetical protein